VLFDGLPELRHIPGDHVSNRIPGRAESMIEGASGWVLNLSAGGTEVQRDHVIEVEASIFRHTDVIADAHRLPFEGSTFDAVIALNCFEHFHSPMLAAAEISRVLRPGGSVLIHTAFLQPLHEAPTHFYNTTSIGLRQWFGDFEIDSLSVTENFNPIYALSWTTAEVLECLKRDVSLQSAVAFGATTISELAAYWLDPSQRNHPRWAPLFELSDASRERTAAGFELVGRRPR
jgi:SAM-dependent methyltransferase